MDKSRADRFFIPIAEEYIKAGKLDEAIVVLKKGLQKYPNYLGARVSLGKVHLEKGMIDEAMIEFENVVQVSPDNLFAYRRLVVIYKDLGRIDDAIKACEKVLEFSPRDKDITEVLSNLLAEKMESAHRHEETVVQPQSMVSPRDEGAGIDFTAAWEVEPEAEQEEQPQEPVLETVMDEFATETIGDLYTLQGEVEKGAEIYRRILGKEPDNQAVKEKLSGLADERSRQIDRLQDFLERIQKNKRQM